MLFDLHFATSQNLELLAVDVDLDQIACVEIQRVKRQIMWAPGFADVREFSPDAAASIGFVAGGDKCVYRLA